MTLLVGSTTIDYAGLDDLNLGSEWFWQTYYASQF